MMESEMGLKKVVTAETGCGFGVRLGVLLEFFSCSMVIDLMPNPANCVSETGWREPNPDAIFC